MHCSICYHLYSLNKTYISFWWFNNVRSRSSHNGHKLIHIRQKSNCYDIVQCSIVHYSPSNPQAPRQSWKNVLRIYALVICTHIRSSKLKRHSFMESPTPRTFADKAIWIKFNSCCLLFELVELIKCIKATGTIYHLPSLSIRKSNPPSSRPPFLLDWSRIRCHEENKWY